MIVAILSFDRIYTARMSLPLEKRLGNDVHRVDQKLMAVKHGALRESGLTVPQYSAMYVLASSPGISAAALARACGVKPQSMGTVLQGLERAGLVEREPHEWHRNVVEARLTAAGESALVLADAAASAVEQRLLDRFSAKERETLRAYLERCGEELDAISAEQPPPAGTARPSPSAGSAGAG